MQAALFPSSPPDASFDAGRYPDPSLFAGLEPDAAARWAAYFYTEPRRVDASPSLRQRVFALYDPFARRSAFPAGIRYCCNVYTGCAHRCGYCYCRNYIRDFDRARPKERFLDRARRDIAAMARLDLPPAPLHLSNSTDPLQPGLERARRDTRGLLALVAAQRARFGPLTILTKNPLLAAQPDYVDLLHAVQPCTVEVSLAFADDFGRRLYEPAAPSVAARREGVRRLCAAKVPVSLRVDPLLPREPLPSTYWNRARLADYGIERTHTLDELRELVLFAADSGCLRVIVSPLKVPVGRLSPSPLHAVFRRLYAEACGGRAAVRGFSLRLPEDYVREELFAPVLALGREYGIEVVHCKRNLVETR